MAKVFDFQWQIPVPDFLLQGACFDRWEEVRSSLCVWSVIKVTARY